VLYRKLAGARPFDSTRRWPETVAARWLDIRCLARGLRLAGASTVSVLIGFLLFYGAPQAQDLFLEVKGNTAAGVSFWLMFYFSVVFMWALPVYVSSRWILDRHDVDHDGYTATDRVPVWVRRNIPPLLTVLCFIAVMVGQLMALRNAPSVVDYSIAARLEFADTLWAGGQSMWRQIVATLQSAGIYAAHSLSVTIFFAIYIILGAGLLWMNLRGRAGRLSHRVWSVLWWLVTLLVFLPLFLMAAIFLWSFTEEQFRIAFSLGHLAVLPPVTAAAAYIAWWGMRPQPDGASRIGGLLLRLRRHAGERDETAASAKLINPIFFTLLASTVILILCGIILHPIGITEYVYRAQMLPVLLGLPVAFVTYLSDWSVRFRAPLIIAAILLVALGTSLIGDTNDVRTVSGAPARPSLKQSIERWAEANECDLRAAEGPRKCPPPIIVTAAGGASRASFFDPGRRYEACWPPNRPKQSRLPSRHRPNQQ
jgi:hypothetical protein